MYEHRKPFIWLHYRDVHSAFHRNVDHNLYYIRNTTAGSADDICYDGYDLNHKTTIKILFLRDSMWINPTV
jgi:hypothetical protein